MPRTKYETVTLTWQGVPETIQPFVYHPEEWDCEADEEEGCYYCQEEIESVEEDIIKLFRQKGRDVVSTFYSNRADGEGFWEFEVASRKAI